MARFDPASSATVRRRTIATYSSYREAGRLTTGRAALVGAMQGALIGLLFEVADEARRMLEGAPRLEGPA